MAIQYFIHLLIFSHLNTDIGLFLYFYYLIGKSFLEKMSRALSFTLIVYLPR